MQTRIWERVWKTHNKGLTVLDKSELLCSLPKQTKETALTDLLAMISETLDRRMCLLAKLGEAAILQRERGILKCHKVTLHRAKEEKRRARNAWRDNQAVYTQEPASKGSCRGTRVVLACLKFQRKDTVLCLLCCRKTFLAFTLLSSQCDHPVKSRT